MRLADEFLSLRAGRATASRATVRTGRWQAEIIRANYLVGCDGGTSPVRQALGIKLRGEGNLLALRQALYRCDELFDRLPIGNGPGAGRHYHVADDKATLPHHAGFDQALDACMRSSRATRR